MQGFMMLRDAVTSSRMRTKPLAGEPQGQTVMGGRYDQVH
jgi:hypothetical protein